MMRRIASIALNTFKESVRERVLYALIAIAALMIAAGLLFGSISVGIEENILANLGLSSISFFGILMAVFIGISLVWKELDRRTLYNVLSKPVARPEFILGKYLGLLLTLVVNTALMTLAYYAALLILKHRLESGDLASLEAVYFILLELALVVAVALLFSCISSPALSALFTLSIFVIGHFVGDIRGFGEQSGSRVIKVMTTAVYYLLPDLRGFDFIAAAAHGRLAPSYLVISNSCYALLYVTLLLSASVLIFEERELK